MNFAPRLLPASRAELARPGFASSRKVLALSALSCAMALALPLAHVQAQPAAEGSAKAQPDPKRSQSFIGLRDQLASAAQANNWPEAERLARELLQRADQGGNPYEQLDASELLTVVLYRQQKYGDAVKLARVMLDAARAHPEDTIMGQTGALISRGLMAAVAAQDLAAIQYFQQALREDSRLFPGLWQWDEAKASLLYRAAQLRLPLRVGEGAGRWVLQHIEPAKDRDESVRLRYLYFGADEVRLTVDLDLRYRNRGEPQALKPIYDDATEADAPNFGLPFAGAQQKRFVRLDNDEERRRTQTWEWVAQRGRWSLDVRADFLPKSKAVAQAQLPQLFAAIDWPAAPDLPGTPADAMTAQQREDAQQLQWRPSADWPRVARLAAQAEKDAIFPNEIARLSTLQGIAAFKQGQWNAASQSLTRALQTWPYASLGRSEEELEENAQQFGAAMALREGRSADAARMMRHYLRDAGGLERRWVLGTEADPTQASLRNQRTGQVLPLWAQGFYLQVPRDSQRMLYRDLATEDKLGLTMELKIPETDAAQEKLLRQAMEKQFRVNAGALKKQGFTPRPRADGKPLKGQQWVFEVKPQVEEGSKTAATRRMVFWIVDEGSRRSILRAGVATREQEQRARQLADALGW